MEEQQQSQAPPPPSIAKKPITLKIPNSSFISIANPSVTTPGGAASATALSPALQTPSGGPRKIKLISSKSQPQTPADGVPPSAVMGPPPPPVFPAGDAGAIVATPRAATPKILTKTQSGRVMKPSAKKRAKTEIDEDGDMGANGEPKATKIKLLKTPTVGRRPALARAPTLKLRTRQGSIPQRPPGDGYDSEAEDRELDPVIEEQFIFRMLPGDHCEYIRKAIQERRIGLPKSQGGADVQIKWLDDEGRRCMVTVQGQPYVAILLDLPTITESMKTWDKKAFVKSADICQMLLVFAQVKSEEEAKKAPLPKAVEHGHRWPHGLTPPMHDCRNRRFRKRLSKLEIQNKEAEVERLLAADRSAVGTKYEFVDERHNRETAEDSGEDDEMEDEEDADADGEMDDYFGDAGLQEDDTELFVDDALLEAEFMDAAETPAEGMDLATPALGLEVATPMTANTATPAAQADESGVDADGADDESGDEEDEEDGEDGDVDDDGDEDRHDEVAGVRVDIANLKKQLAHVEQQLAKSVQPIMRKRLEASIRNIRSELELKKSSIGDVNED